MHDDNYSTRLNTILESQAAARALRIELFFQGKLLTVEKSEMPYYMGRDENSCDLIFEDSAVSRRHCVLQMRGNQIGILDTSTNGTFIQPGRSAVLHIHNEFYPMVGKGVIRMGRMIEDEDPELVFYKVVTS